MGEMNFMGLIKSGGITMVILIICSIISITIIVERYLKYLAVKRSNPRQIVTHIKSALKKTGQRIEQRDLDEGSRICDMSSGPAASMIKAGIKAYQSGDDVEPAMERVAGEQVSLLEKGLIVLGTLGNVAPFIGLFGTVVGVTNAFIGIAHSAQSGGGGDIATIGAGIAQALVTTAAGLFVAVPAVIAFNYYTWKVDRFAEELETVGDEITKHLGAGK